MSNIEDLQKDRRYNESKKSGWELLYNITNLLKWAFGLGILVGVTIVSLAEFSGLYNLLVIALGSAGMYGSNILTNLIERGPLVNYEEALNVVNKQVNDLEGQRGLVKRERVEMQLAPTPKKPTSSGTKPNYSYDAALNVNVAESPELTSNGRDIPSYLTGRR